MYSLKFSKMAASVARTE